MNVSWLTLRDLEYLTAVARLGHFGKAAESCHVSQPSLSAQIKKIEEFLDVILFERSNRRVTITEVGQRVVNQAQVVLEEAQKIISVLGTSTKPLMGTFRLGAIATLGPYLVPHFLGQLRKSYPQLHLIIREGLTEPLLEELRAGHLDAVLAARTFSESGFKVTSLFTEPFVLAAPHSHPLAQKEPLSLKDLKASEMVLLEDGHCLRDQVVEFCPTNKRGHIQQFHATSVETLRHLVASGAGYTLLPKLAVSEKPLKSLVKYREFSKQDVGREVVLVCRDRYPNMIDIQALAEIVSGSVNL